MVTSNSSRKIYDRADKSNVGIVYMAVNLLNDKKYVGITACPLNKRISGHWSSAKDKKKNRTIFSSALIKYGRDNIVFHKILDAGSYEKAKIIERYLIEVLKPEYNITQGGEGCLGYKHSPENLKKMSDRGKLNPHVFQKGHKHSKETIEKMTRTKLLNPYPGYWIGKKRDPETVEKIRIAKTGKPLLTRRGISPSKAALDASAAVRRKAVVCITDGKEFLSASDAAKYYKSSRAVVSRVCNGDRNSNFGLVFQWRDN